MECFVYDKLVQAVLEGVPSEAWRRSGDLNGTLEDLDIRRWFSQQPFVTDSNVFSNTEQHFVRGCSYTISLWVWLYKPRFLPDHEIAVLTTRDIGSPHKFNVYQDESILPSVVFNVGGLPERLNKYFFATSFDEMGHYQGFWSATEVRYHEWVHVAMSISGDSFTAYINGIPSGSVYMGPPRRGKSDTYCPYKTAPTAPHTYVPKTSPVANTTAPPPDRARPYSFAPYPPNEAINNTVMQVGGRNNGQLPTASGMFADLVVVRNAALTADQILLLKGRGVGGASSRRTSRTLSRLLRAYGKMSLEGFTPLDIAGYDLAWRQRSWGLCPDAVCGPVSVSEEFRLGPPPPRSFSTEQKKLRVERRVRPVASGRIHSSEPVAAEGSSGHGGSSGVLVGDPLFGGDGDGANGDDPYSYALEDALYMDDAEFYAEEAAYLEAVAAGDLVYGSEADAEYFYGSDMYADGLGEGDVAEGQDQHGPDKPGWRRAGHKGSAKDGSLAHGNNATGHSQRPSLFHELFPRAMADFPGQLSGRVGASASGVGAGHKGSDGPRLRRLVPQVLLVREEKEQATTYFIGGRDSWTRMVGNLTSLFRSGDVSTHTGEGPDLLSAILDWTRRVGPVFTSVATESVNLLHELWCESTEWLLAIVSPGLTSKNGLAPDTANATSSGDSPAPALDTATELYHAAMLLLNDRHLAEGGLGKRLTRASADTAAQDGETLSSWKRRTSEQAVAYLSLALWLAGEEPPVHSWMGGGFRNAPHSTQPIHLALGFAAGFDATDDVRLPSDLGIYLERVLGGGNLYALLGLNHSSGFDAIEVLSRSLGPGPGPGPTGQRRGSLAVHVDSAGNTRTDKAGLGAPTPYVDWLQQLDRSRLVHPEDPFFDNRAVLHPELRPFFALLLKPENVSSTTSSSGATESERTLFGFSSSPRLQAIAALEALRQGAEERARGHAEPAWIRKLVGPEIELMNPEGRTTYALVNAFPEIRQAKLLSPVPSDSENECFRAVAHYFPVSQYVTANFGMVDTGVALLEDVRLSEGMYLGQAGEGDELQLHNEAEAEAGNTEAQMWLGRRYFWGYGGLQPNAAQARRWFERAAALGDAEGMYNVGVFHNNGQAGLAVNPDAALEYFIRAANAPNPFPMALHALGQHYLSPSNQNLTLARDYFLRAAELNSADGHFSLAMMYRDGSASNGIADIPLCVTHLALAIQLGHVRASNFLAHGLIDPESWFHLYGREVEAESRLAKAGFLESPSEALVRASAHGDVGRVRALLLEGRADVSHVSADGAGPTALTAATQGGFAEVVRALLRAGASASQKDGQGVSAIEAARSHGHQGVISLLEDNLDAKARVGEYYGGAESEVLGGSGGSHTVPFRQSLWSFNASQHIMLHLPSGSFAIPLPLGRGDSCPVALQLLKNIAENSYRPNDLNRAALAKYLAGDRWGALELYDEAAVLGVQSAMENAAWLYDDLAEEQCLGAPNERVLEKWCQLDLWWVQKLVRWVIWLLPDSLREPFLSRVGDWTGSEAQHPLSACREVQRSAATELRNACLNYFDKMSVRRSTQMANTGDHVARRDIADKYARAPPRNRAEAARLALQPNHSHAALLYALAAEQGDVHSVVHLAWLFSGVRSSVVPNVTAARVLFRAASDMELRDDGYGHMPLHTMGMASQLGLLTLWAIEVANWFTMYENNLLAVSSVALVLLAVARRFNNSFRTAIREELRARREDEEESNSEQ